MDRVKILMEAKEKGLADFKHTKNKEDDNVSILTINAKRFNPYTGDEEKTEKIVYTKQQFLAIIQQCDNIIADWTSRKEQTQAMLEHFKDE